MVRRFIAESLYGIQARQSVRLTEIARSLEEEIPLCKTQYRLCRQLGRDGLWRRIIHALLRRAASRIREDTLLIMDLSDISKKYARKIEPLPGMGRQRRGGEQRILDLQCGRGRGG